MTTSHLHVAPPRALGFVPAVMLAAAMLGFAPSTASADIYAFVGGGLGPSFRGLGTSTVQPTLRIGPSAELGGESGLFHLSGSVDIRFLFGPVDGATAAPVDLDLLANFGLVVPTPVVQPVFRLRVGPGWEWTSSRADLAVVFGFDFGVRIRAPGAPAALVLSVAPTARVPPSGPEHAAMHIELRVGATFP